MSAHPLQIEVTPERLEAWVTSTRQAAPAQRVIVLGAASQAVLDTPVRGRGGFQSLLRRLQRGRHGELLTITQHDMDLLVKHCRGGLAGGFQRRCRALLVDALLTTIARGDHPFVLVKR